MQQSAYLEKNQNFTDDDSKTSTNPGVHDEQVLSERKKEDPEKYLYFARIRSRISISEQGAKAYRKAVELYLDSDLELAVKTYREFHETHSKAFLSPQNQYRMAQLLHQRGDTGFASRCLQLLLKKKDVSDELRSKTLFHLGRLLNEMGLHEAARARWKELVRKYPKFSWSNQAARRLGLSHVATQGVSP